MMTRTFKEHVRLREYIRGDVATEQAFEDKILYVRPDGNDYNDGSQDLPEFAFASLQGVADYLKLWDGNGFDCYIYVADGTYTQTDTQYIRDLSGWRKVIVEGNNTNPENVVLYYDDDIYKNILEFVNCDSQILVSGLMIQGGSNGRKYGLAFTNCRFGQVIDTNGAGKMIMKDLRIVIRCNNSFVEVYADLKLQGAIGLSSVFSASGPYYVGYYSDVIDVEGTLNTIQGVWNAGTQATLDCYIGTWNVTGSQTGPSYAAANYASFYSNKVATTFGSTGPSGSFCRAMSNFQGTFFIPKTTTVAGLVTTVPAGSLTFVTNETGGACYAVFDGTNWRRIYDNAVVSA